MTDRAAGVALAAVQEGASARVGMLRVGDAASGFAAVPGARALPEEAAVAITLDRAAFAVMLATPADLADFATGLLLSEGIVRGQEEITALEIVALDGGIEARVDLAPAAAARASARRRHLLGAGGCGLCGVESLAAALPALPQLRARRVLTPAEVAAAVASLAPAQVLGAATRAVHAAGFWRAGAGLLALREDVGRHNALDKLIGAMARAGIEADDGIVVLTSRIGLELVQKAARAGMAQMVAISAPSAAAVRAAQGCGMGLIGIARADGYEVFTAPRGPA